MKKINEARIVSFSIIYNAPQLVVCIVYVCLVCMFAIRINVVVLVYLLNVFRVARV
jgi:hypothetical protein